MEILIYILLFYVGFYFYRLAENHQKNKWIYGFVGIATYFTGTIMYPLFIRLSYSEEIYDFDLAKITLKSCLIGFSCVFFLFNILSFVWSKKNKINDKDIDKIGD